MQQNKLKNSKSCGKKTLLWVQDNYVDENFENVT